MSLSLPPISVMSPEIAVFALRTHVVHARFTHNLDGIFLLPGWPNTAYLKSICYHMRGSSSSDRRQRRRSIKSDSLCHAPATKNCHFLFFDQTVPLDHSTHLWLIFPFFDITIASTWNRLLEPKVCNKVGRYTSSGTLKLCIDARPDSRAEALDQSWHDQDQWTYSTNRASLYVRSRSPRNVLCNPGESTVSLVISSLHPMSADTPHVVRRWSFSGLQSSMASIKIEFSFVLDQTIQVSYMLITTQRQWFPVFYNYM